MTPQMQILVTGGTGFIGSHCVFELLQVNYNVTVIGSLSNTVLDCNGEPVSLKRIQAMTGKPINFKKIDLLNKTHLEEIFKSETFDVVMHLASLKGVGESCIDPLKFYHNNIIGSLNLIDLCKKYKVKNLIFSSSPAAYGTPLEFPIKETSATGIGITNPYGKSKYMIENILKDISNSDKEWNIICLRYFNPTGAHPSGLIGECSKGTQKQLMPCINEVLNGKLPFVLIYGDDFDTPDGTCIRDYIHVVDAARGHLCALNRIFNEKHIGFEAYNLGMGKGYSVLEIVKSMENATEQKIPTKIMPRRIGDVACLYCDPLSAAKNLKWKTHFTLENICRDVSNWRKMSPNGYFDECQETLKKG